MSDTARRGSGEPARVVTGSRLGIRPGETAAERSLELQSRLSVAEHQNEVLATHVEELETALRQQNQRLADAASEAQANRLREQVETILAGEAVSEEKAARIADAVLAHRETTAQPSRGTNAVRLVQHTEPIPLSDAPIDSPVFEEPEDAVISPVPTQGPAVSGSRLGILPGSTASERCFELMARMKAVEEEKAALQEEVVRLQRVNERQQEKLVQATDEIRASREELQQVRALLDGWKKDMGDLRQRARSAETENMETLRAIVTLLQELMGEESPREPSVQQPNGE